LTPEKPKQSFADRLASVSKEHKRKRDVLEMKQRKRTRGFSSTAHSHVKSHDTTTTITTTTSSDNEEWCRYTGFNLRNRLLPQSVLKQEFKEKTTYSISDLYRLITPPLYELPEYDTPDFLVTGIVASKSPVRQVKGREDGGNYLVMTLTDLKVPPPLL
jgi:hypothetical protein